MALLFNQNEQRSELQKRIAAELQDRARQKKNDADLPDGVEDSAYIKDMKQTTPLAWVWILIVLIGLGTLIWLISSFAR